jgi:NTE family protein
MGAVVGVTYALRADWYEALLDTEIGVGRSPLYARPDDGNGLLTVPARVRRIAARVQGLRRIMTEWGPEPAVLEAGLDFIERLFGSATLEDCHVPVAVSSTDLRTGERVVVTVGPAQECVYASSALAGVVPPVEDGSKLLADGAYSDVAPVDVARSYPVSHVLAVDPGQLHHEVTITNGLEAMLRASEVCYTRHSELRFRQADLVIRPAFRRAIDTLDFAARREVVAAGIVGVRRVLPELRTMLGAGEGTRSGGIQSKVSDRVDPR